MYVLPPTTAVNRRDPSFDVIMPTSLVNLLSFFPAIAFILIVKFYIYAIKCNHKHGEKKRV